MDDDGSLFFSETIGEGEEVPLSFNFESVLEGNIVTNISIGWGHIVSSEMIIAVSLPYCEGSVTDDIQVSSRIVDGHSGHYVPRLVLS